MPGGNTILHKLFKRGDIIEQIFKTAHPNEDDKNEKLFHIPFIQNLLKQSAMHKCKKSSDVRAINTMLEYL